MRVKICRHRLFTLLCVSSLLLLFSEPAGAQDRVPPDSRVTPEQALASDLRTFADAIRALQTQVQSLTSEVSELRGNQQRVSAETALLRSELDAAKAELASKSSPPPSSPTRSPEALTAAQTVPESNVEQRVTKLEDAQQLIDARIAEQNQTKVESGSKYRLRLSGIVLVNLFHTQGTVDNLDFPQIAIPRDQSESSRAFGASLRQSQIELNGFGPDFAGAHTSANLKFDFAGGFAGTPNGVTMGVVRLRSGTIRLDWPKTSIVAGQDNLFFAPLIPTSLASLAIPPLAYAGRLWNWTPQVRVEHQIALSESNRLLLQGGILDSLTGDFAQSGYRYPTAGEQSGQPAYASRIALRHDAFGKEFALGAGGYYARQNWGFGRNVDSWAVTTDLSLPITNWLTLSGEFYRGRAVGGLGGAIGQTILLSGKYSDSTTALRGLDSMGGWMQIKLKPKANFEVNAALGQDNPYSAELRRFPATSQYYGPLQSRNLSPFFNFIYQLRSDVLFSAEYRRLQSYPLDGKPNKANQISLSMGYLF